MPAADTNDAWSQVLTAPDLNPWGGPGPNFIARRRAWLHQARPVQPPAVKPPLWLLGTAKSAGPTGQVGARR